MAKPTRRMFPDCYRAVCQQTTLSEERFEIGQREPEPEFRTTPRHVDGKDAVWWAERGDRQTTAAPDLDVHQDPFRYYFKF